MDSQEKRHQLKLTIWVALICLTLATALVLAGCQSADPQPVSSAGESPKVLGIFPPPPERSGAELWANNCNRCHYAPPPERFSDAQWDVIVHHMRLRANLTGDEQRKITAFLQASN